MQVVADGARPILSFDRHLVLFDRLTKFLQQIGIGPTCREDGGQFEHPPELVDLMHIAQGKLRHRHSAMKAAAEKVGSAREKPTLMSFRDGVETLTHALQGKLGGAIRTAVRQNWHDYSEPSMYVQLTSGWDASQGFSSAVQKRAIPSMRRSSL